MVHRWLAELRRRRVLRVAGAYVVAGWGVLQAVEAFAPMLGLPSWTIGLSAMLLLAGLPVTLATVWALHGTSGDSEAGAGASWVDVGLLAAAGAVVLVTAAQWLMAGDPAPDGGTRMVAVAADGAGPSVAVLPFASFSGDAEDGYFSDGLSEELINSLAQIEGLKVSGRTSSFHFKGRNEDLRDIGRQLGVGHVLEGSVRRAGERLRVTVQLVSAADGFHLWSHTYDRNLDDVFAIQQDIAEQVARMLRATLLDGEAPPRQRESAYSSMVATALLGERSPDSLTEARALFQDILANDPDDVEALAGFARATMWLAGAYLTLDFEPAAAESVSAVERAVALAPDSVTANVAAGTVYDILALRTEERHYLALADRALARALDIAPGDPEVLRTYAALLVRQGRWELAVTIGERAVTHDPLDDSLRLVLAEALRGAGRLADARSGLEQVLLRRPDYDDAHLELGELYMETGALDLALTHLKAAHAARSSPRASFALANVYLNLGLRRQVLATLEELDYAPQSIPLGEMVRFHISGDERGALRHAEAELARSGDRIWRPLVVLAALNAGDLAKAREQIRLLEPEVLGPAPDVARMTPGTVLLAANLLMCEERTEQAARLLELLLDEHAPPAEGFDPVANKLVRAQALAQLGRDDEALDELADARRQGYRTLFDFDNFLRLDRYPAFAALRSHPRFVELLSAIEAENHALGARLETA